jgi:hypothetical protein
MRTIEAVRSEIDSLTAKRDALATEADALQDRSEPNQQEHRHRLMAGSANLQTKSDALRAEYGQILLRGVEDGTFSTETVDQTPADRIGPLLQPLAGRIGRPSRCRAAQGPTRPGSWRSPRAPHPRPRHRSGRHRRALPGGGGQRVLPLGLLAHRQGPDLRAPVDDGGRN